jgi:hypothetical protein
MKRALVVSFLAALGLAIVACDDGAGEGKLTNGDGAGANKLGGKDESDGETETPPSQKKSDTSNPVTPPAQQTPPPQSTPAPANPTDCSAQADLKTCATCCATNNNPANACACGAGAKCADKCTDNLCTQKTPSLQCILCLGQSGCDLGFGGGGGGAENSPAAQCLQACNTKFGQK